MSPVPRAKARCYSEELQPEFFSNLQSPLLLRTADSVANCQRTLAAERLHELLEGGALLAGGRQVRQARQAAEVAVEVAADLQAAGSENLFSEVGRFAQARLLLFGERVVAIL